MGSDVEAAIRKAYLEGTLQVEAVSNAGKTKHYSVTKVFRHSSGHKRMVRLTLVDGRFGDFTEDHSVFFVQEGCPNPVKAGQVAVDDLVAVVDDGVLQEARVAKVTDIPPQEYTYDLSVPGPENFRLTNGILAHNSYSIGGVSLDLEKSAKYQSMADSASAQFDKAAEAKSRTVKFIRGLQQPRFGIGVRSAFGPYVGRGVLSPRSFIVCPLFLTLGGFLSNLLGG